MRRPAARISLVSASVRDLTCGARARPCDGRPVTHSDSTPPPRQRPVRAVVFDVGETLVNETTEFFKALIDECGMPAEQIAYVGDRLDNDIQPALAAGLVGVFVRRGPWGYQHQHAPEVARAHVRVLGLTELPDALAAYNTDRG